MDKQTGKTGPLENTFESALGVLLSQSVARGGSRNGVWYTLGRVLGISRPAGDKGLFLLEKQFMHGCSVDDIFRMI